MATAMASAMKKGRRAAHINAGSARAVMTVCMVVALLAFMGTAHAARDQLAGHKGGVQTTHKSSASTLAFGQQSLFQCPCSYQFCDGTKWRSCSCNVKVCSCSCHNYPAQTKVAGPAGATIQLRPSKP